MRCGLTANYLCGYGLLPLIYVAMASKAVSAYSVVTLKTLLGSVKIKQLTSKM